MPGVGASRNIFAWILIILSLVTSTAFSQTPGAAPTANPTGMWKVFIPTGPNEFFPTPDAACRRQQEYYNPNATYQPPIYRSPIGYDCNWLARQFGGPLDSNTILPGSVSLNCPASFVRTRLGTCAPWHDNEPECDCSEDTRLVSAGPAPIVGNPVSISTGSKIEYESDYETADGLFRVDRRYRSKQHVSDQWTTTPIPGFGSTWHGVLPGRLAVHGPYLQFVEYLTASGGYDYFKAADQHDVTSWAYFDPGGNSQEIRASISRRKFEAVTVPSVNRDQFFKVDASVLNGAAEFKLTESDGTYVYYRRADTWYVADALRYLIPIQKVYPGGYTQYFDYDDTGQFPSKVRDSFGREMLLTWADAKLKSYSVATTGGGGGGGGSPSIIQYGGVQPAKVITEIQLPDATRLVYSYGDSSSEERMGRDDVLKRVSRKDALGTELWAREYVYEDAAYPYALTGILDQDDQRLSTYTYHPNGLVKSSERAGGVGKVEFEHTFTTDTRGKTNYHTVINPLGHESVYEFRRARTEAPSSVPSSLLKVESLASATVSASTVTYGYQPAARYSRVDMMNTMNDARGVTTNLTNDLPNLRPTSIIEAVGTPAARTTNIQWQALLDLPLRIDVPGLRTEMTYGTTGELLTRTLTDTTTHTLPYETAGQTRTETYSWGMGGRLMSINGPRAAVGLQDDVTSFTYDVDGNLLTMTNGVGQVSTYGGHDENGRPASVIDPNGVQTLFVYDALGRLESSTIKHPTATTLDAITTYDYDVEGRVTGVTLPATDKLSFIYDLAGQLLEIAAPDGEKQTFSYDAMGNVTEQKIKRVDDTARSTISRTFDSIGRMLTETLGPGRTTAWQYDKNGNPVRTTSPRSHATDMAFDALNRLTSAVAPDTGTTATLYNAKDESTRFTDAVGVQTNFVRNGFGEVIQEVSPDRGTSIYHYDAAGDLAAAIDGRGQRIDYMRDILGRVTTKTPVGRPASEIVTYAYDSGGVSGCACVGRLASMTDASGTTSFGYDHRGNLTAKAQPIGTLGWSYDLADRVVQVSYPSGRDVNYARDTKGRVVEVQTRPDSGSAWTTLATNIAYEPFGPMKSADLGNGLKLSQDWGSDRRLASKRLYTGSGSDVWHVSYGYDSDDNITSLTDHVTAANSRSFGYDSVDRLTRVDGGTAGFAREDYVHDKNGNLTTIERRVNVGDAASAQSDVHVRTSGTNRLASVAHPGGVRSFTHDARGNLIADTRPTGAGVTLDYDGYARLANYGRAGAETQTMLYNGFDERVGLTTTLGGSLVEERRYAYDSDHRIVGEYGAAPTELRAEHIWLQPEVGTTSPFGGDDGVSGYMPLAVAIPDGTASKIHWVQGNHLGTPVATTDPSGAIVTPSGYGRIGFPGQVEQHADLYYNYYRDYDPTLGRYVQADPIGLDGGNNPYLYVGGNPLKRTDPHGLGPEIVLCVFAGPAAPACAGIDVIASGLVLAVGVASLNQPNVVPRPQGMSPLEERQYDRYCSNSDDPCSALKAEIRRAITQARVKMAAMQQDKGGLFGTIGWTTHATDLAGRLNAINAMISLGKKMGCDMGAEMQLLSSLVVPRSPR